MPDPRPVFFFDIDNCLYPRSLNINAHMQALIDAYFSRHLALSAADATMLHAKYYSEYGLAISGLATHHRIDPLAYNREVDDALPLDALIHPDRALRRLLQDVVDTGQVRLWLFTNAYVTHAMRVVNLLGVADLFEGVTYCDYAQLPLVAKPHEEMFRKAEAEAGVLRAADAYFVDDSALNCRFAKQRGWRVVHKLEEGDADSGVGDHRVRSLEELRGLFPQFFKGRPDADAEVNGKVGGSSQL